MTTAAIKGYGTTLKQGVETADTAVAEVLDISLSGYTVDDIEVASMGSPSSTKEYLPGLKEGGEVSCDCVYEKAKYETLLGLVGDKRKWAIELPDGASWSFDGYLKGLPGEIPVNDYVRNTLTIRVSSTFTFAQGTGTTGGT